MRPDSDSEEEEYDDRIVQEAIERTFAQKREEFSIVTQIIVFFVLVTFAIWLGATTNG